MTKPDMFRASNEREFFAHHMLLTASETEIAAAERGPEGQFNRCLASMVMSALAVEALLNAVGSRVAPDWSIFERLRPYEKLDSLIMQLAIPRDTRSEPWETLTFLAKFLNDIAHPKPEALTCEKILPEIALEKAGAARPLSALERDVTLGNARRSFSAVKNLKGILTDALPEHARFGIYADMWAGGVTKA